MITLQKRLAAIAEAERLNAITDLDNAATEFEQIVDAEESCIRALPHLEKAIDRLRSVKALRAVAREEAEEASDEARADTQRPEAISRQA